MSLRDNANNRTTVASFPNLSEFDTNSERTLDKCIQDWFKKSNYGFDFGSSSSTYSGDPIGTAKSDEREKKMNDNDLLKAYIEKINQDQSELRADIRESERRTSERLDKIEKRMDDRLNRIEDMIRDSRKSNEGAIEELKTSVNSKMGWVVGTCIATILGIAAMVVSVVTPLWGIGQ